MVADRPLTDLEYGEVGNKERGIRKKEVKK
jgi:hypothetical protein